MSPTLTGKKSRRCKKKLEWRKEKEKNVEKNYLNELYKNH